MSNSLTDGEAIVVTSIAGEGTNIAEAHDIELGLRQVCTDCIHAALRQRRLQGKYTDKHAYYLSGASNNCHYFLEGGESR